MNSTAKTSFAKTSLMKAGLFMSAGAVVAGVALPSAAAGPKPLKNAVAIVQTVGEMSEPGPRPSFALFADGRVAYRNGANGVYYEAKLTSEGEKELLVALELSSAEAQKPFPPELIPPQPDGLLFACPSDVGVTQLVTPNHPVPVGLFCLSGLPSVVEAVRLGTFAGLDRTFQVRIAAFEKFAVMAFPIGPGDVPPDITVKSWRGPALRVSADRFRCTIVKDRRPTLEINYLSASMTIYRSKGKQYLLQTYPLVGDQRFCV